MPESEGFSGFKEKPSDTRHQRLPEFHFFCFEHGLRVDIKR
jgi:hypothetical protein